MYICHHHILLRAGRGPGAASKDEAALLEASAHLTDRDRLLVRLVAEHRVLTTDQLTALGFANLTTARHRLAVLVRLGLLRRFRPHPPTGSAPWHYVLGPVGAALLGVEDRDERKWVPQARADRQLGLERSPRLGHMLGRNQFFVALAAHARERGGELREWRNETQAAAHAVDGLLVAPGTWDRLPRPDGAGTWAEDTREVSFLLEYDLGTEHLSVLAAKLDGYALLASVLADAGQAAPPPLFCFGSPRREQGARRALAACRDSAAVRIATTAIDPYATSPAGPVWLPLSGHQGRQVRLIDLDAALPDPWRDHRARRAREHREAAEREQALLRADEDDDEPAMYGTAAGEEAFGRGRDSGTGPGRVGVPLRCTLQVHSVVPSDRYTCARSRRRSGACLMAPYRPRLTCNTKVFHDLPAKDAGKGTAKFRCCRCWLAFHSATVAERGHALYRDDQDDAGSGAVQ